MYEIGLITTTHGIKGELKVRDLSDFDRFKKDEEVFIVFNNEEIHLTVENVKYQKNNLIVKFYEYNNINEVLDYKGLLIYSKEKGTLEEGEYHYEDLFDLDVYDDKNNLIGKVTDIMDLPHGKVLVVTKDNERNLIPFHGEFIKEVKDDKIIVTPIEGLLWLLI